MEGYTIRGHAIAMIRVCRAQPNRIPFDLVLSKTVRNISICGFELLKLPVIYLHRAHACCDLVEFVIRYGKREHHALKQIMESTAD
jgi:hypothetical protein